MLVDPGDTVVLLPAATRYEQRDGGTQTTTERGIVFSPEIPRVASGGGAQRVGDLRRPGSAYRRVTRALDGLRVGLGHPGGDRPRGAVVRGCRTIARDGRSGAVGRGAPLRRPPRPQFPTADGKARFTPVRPPASTPGNGLRLSTRRGKQFNTMVHAEIDPLTGAARDNVFISDADADRLGLAEGAPVVVRSSHGELRAQVCRAPLRPGNVQAFYPEGNVLLPELASDPSYQGRFRREIGVAFRVTGPHAARVLAADLDADEPYFVTEYVDGPTLAERVHKRGPMSGRSFATLRSGLPRALC
jgi:hypothetical protein